MFTSAMVYTYCMQNGIIVRRNQGEWRITYNGTDIRAMYKDMRLANRGQVYKKQEAVAYYTTDAEDAYHTAMRYVEQRKQLIGR